MLLGDDAHHVQAEAEVQVVLRRAMGNHGLEERARRLLRQRRPTVRHDDARVLPARVQLHGDRAVRAMEVHGIVDELVEQLLDAVVGGADVDRARCAAKHELPSGMGGAAVADVALDQRLDVEHFHVLGREGILQARRVGEVLHDGADAQHAALGALEVLAVAHVGRFLRQVFEGGVERIERVVDLVAQRARHLLQERGVLVEALQHGRDAARQVADFVAGLGSVVERGSAQAAVVVGCRHRFPTQGADAPCQAAGEGNQAQGHDEEARHGDQRNAAGGLALEEQDVVDVLLDADHAEHRAGAGEHRVAGDDRLDLADPSPQRDGLAAEGRGDDARLHGLDAGLLRIVAEEARGHR